MLADDLHPLKVQPRNLAPPQDHLYVLGSLQKTLQETQRDDIRLWDITQSTTPPNRHTLATPHGSAHRHRRHPQHPRSPSRHTARSA